MKTCKVCGQEKGPGAFIQGRGWCDPCIEAYTDECDRRQAAKSLIHRTRIQAREAYRGAHNAPGFFRHMPYTKDELVARLMSTLPEGYTAADACDGRKLHIDHIRPVSSFNLTGEVDAEFLACWALDNLQLLPAKDNLRKSNKWSPHAQAP